MDELYEQLLDDMEDALHVLAKRVPSPQWVELYKNNFAFRYVERMAEQAIVQKLARVISGLRAALLLLKHGLLQEEAVIQRVLGELQEDILFLTYGIIKGHLKDKLHQSYLAEFFQEEYTNPDDPLGSVQKRNQVPRRKIQAYVAAADRSIGDPSHNQAVFRTVFQAFSGYVHGASVHIMDMYGGSPPHFHVRGMLGTPRMPGMERNIWNYFERGMVSFVLAAGIMRDGELQQTLLYQKQKFDTESKRLMEKII